MQESTQPSGYHATLSTMVFAGLGEMRERCRTLDWAATPIGAPAAWPRSLRTIVEVVLAAPTPMIVLWGPENVQIYNDGYREIMGAKHPAGLGQPNRVCWSEVWEFNAPIFDEVLHQGRTFTFTDQRLLLARDGSPAESFFTLTFSPVPDDHGTVGGVLATVFETTAQVRARTERELERERLLAESETARQRLASTLESIGDAFYAVDADFRFTYVNGRAEELLRRPRSALLGQSFWDVFPQSKKTELGRQYCNTMAARRAAHFETCSAVDGRWVDVSVYPDEVSGGLACYLRDITERNAAQTALAKSEAKYRALFDSLDAGFSIIEVLFEGGNGDSPGRACDYRILEANPAFIEQTGLHDATGRRITELVPVQESHWFATYGRVALSGEPTRFEAGAEALGRWYEVYAFRVGEPEQHRVAVLFNDVSERKRAEAERERLLEAAECARGHAERAQAEAESANHAKGEFLAVMSHELRTPLNAIGGYAELMQLGLHGPVTDEQVQALERIQQSQRHLLGLINQVLNYTRIDAGVVRYNCTVVPVTTALADAQVLVLPQVHARGLRLVATDCPPEIAAYADREKMQQVLLNLLSNAIKFTGPGGEVRIACTCDEHNVNIAIADTGIGVAPEKLASIFEPFVQVNQRLTRPHEGVGLGLAISRDLARGMGGEIVATSAHGSGSTFTLTLPRAAAR